MTELKPGWQRVKFGEVVRQVKDKVDPVVSGLTRFIAGEHMDTDDLRIRRWGEIGDGYLGPAFHMRFKPGQVLYGSRRTYLRKVAVPDFEGICANTTFVLESANPEVLLPELLPFVMATEAFHEHSRRESKGSVNPYVNFSDLAWYELALPPLEEQVHLAVVLSAGRRLRDDSNSLHAAIKAVRRSMLVSIFRPDRGGARQVPGTLEGDERCRSGPLPARTAAPPDVRKRKQRKALPAGGQRPGWRHRPFRYSSNALPNGCP